MLNRTLENYSRRAQPEPEKPTNGHHSDHPEDDHGTPKGDKMDIDDPASGGRVTRGEFDLFEAQNPRHTKGWQACDKHRLNGFSTVQQQNRLNREVASPIILQRQEMLMAFSAQVLLLLLSQTTNHVQWLRLSSKPSRHLRTIHHFSRILLADTRNHFAGISQRKPPREPCCPALALQVQTSICVVFALWRAVSPTK